MLIQEAKRWQKLAGLITENEQKENIVSGVLDKVDFNDSIVYYVNTDMGDIYVSTKVVDEIGDKIDNLLGTEGEWEYIVWDHIQTNPSAKYKIVKYLG
jgi:hypothetical protein